MPRPLHPCAEDGCSEQLPHGVSRCAQHERPAFGGAGADYGRDWPRLRAIVLVEELVCRICHMRASTTVDHITPKAQAGSDARSNLQALCEPCAAVKNQQDAAAGRRAAGAVRKMHL